MTADDFDKPIINICLVCRIFPEAASAIPRC
jgi:hypothetical protein